MFREVDPTFLFQSQAEGRANSAIEDIVALEVNRCLAANEVVPTTKDAIVAQAFARGTVKSAADRQAEALISANQPQPAGGTSVSVVPETITDRQFFQGCALQGLCTEAEALDAVKTGTLPARLETFVVNLPAEQRFAARMVLSGAVSFNRSSPLTDAFGQMADMTPAEVDEFWRFCAGL